MSGGNTGRLFAELDASGSGLDGTIGLHDEVHGVIVFACAGRFEGGALKLVCTPPAPMRPGETGELRLVGHQGADGEISGTWTSSSGGEGAFVLFPDPR